MLGGKSCPRQTSVLLKEVVIEPDVKLECTQVLLYLDNKLGAGGVEAARVGVRCACVQGVKYLL